MVRPFSLVQSKAFESEGMISCQLKMVMSVSYLAYEGDGVSAQLCLVLHVPPLVLLCPPFLDFLHPRQQEYSHLAVENLWSRIMSPTFLTIILAVS